MNARLFEGELAEAMVWYLAPNTSLKFVGDDSRFQSVSTRCALVQPKCPCKIVDSSLPLEPNWKCISLVSGCKLFDL